MASKDHQAEETRIRRVLQINSYNFEAFERYLLEQGHVPASTDEQATKDAVFNLRKLFDGNVSVFPSESPHRCIAHIFMAGDDAVTDAQVCESESAKYDAVKNLISMLAARKSQASVVQKQQQRSRVVMAHERKYLGSP